MSHHYSGLDFGFPHGDTRLDFTGLYAFILAYDLKRPASFPHNGRTLTDDVVDVFIPILTNGQVTGDKVGPHNDLLAEFPYVGEPHKSRSAGLVAA